MVAGTIIKPQATADSSRYPGNNNTAKIYTTSLYTIEEEAVNAVRVNKNCAASNREHKANKYFVNSTQGIEEEAEMEHRSK
eukprot:2262882-Lingulodinium_polyedra.AAC.1